MTQDEAETLALHVVAWIMGEDARRDRFMSMTGIEPASLQDRISDPEFLSAALDFLLAFEPDLMAFCEETGSDLFSPGTARQLIGGTEPHWT